MSEGKSGPARSKLRAIWRAEKRKRDALAADLAARPKTGVSAELATDSLAMLDAWLSGRETPVGVIPEAWRAVCAEQNGQA